MDVDKCIELGHLQRIKPDTALAEKEIKEALYDLSDARAMLREKRFKRALATAYYATFHAAKAVLFKHGYWEKAHYAAGVVLGEFAKNGLLESRYASDFKAAMHAREEADYCYSYSKKTAEHVFKIAVGAREAEWISSYSKKTAEHVFKIAEEFVAAMRQLYAKD